MPPFDSLIGLLDSRSFTSIWFWLVLLGLWSVIGRHILGVPNEVVNAARQALRENQAEAPVVLHLLDWLSLTLPRWRMGAREGAVMFGLTAFGLSSLAILGFGYGLELAQALAILGAPFTIVFWMRVRLARRLSPLLADAEDARTPLGPVAAQAVRQMVLHRRVISVLSMISVAITALWGALWAALHPFGM